MSRALLFAATGVGWFIFWFVGGTTQTVESMQQWPNVVRFSAILLLLAVALFTFGRMVGDRSVMRLATFAAAAAAYLSVVNVIEDGFRVEAGFLFFVGGLIALDLILAGLTLITLRDTVGRRKLLALIPGGTLAGILLSPIAGPLILAAWLVASAASWSGSRSSNRVEAVAQVL